jgi:predicted DNA-binding transcriptional regulator
MVVISDVNVHKTNSFLRLNFQFVLISKRNVIIYSWLVENERKIKHFSFKECLVYTCKKLNTNILKKMDE